MMDRAVSLPEAFGGLYCPEKIVTAGFDGLLHGVGLRKLTAMVAVRSHARDWL